MEESIRRIEPWLRVLAENKGSDLYLATGAPPCAKFEGQLKPISKELLKPGDVEAIADEIMDETQRADFRRELEMNLAISIPNCGRFRVNIFRQRNFIPQCVD